ncbi:iron ABC transporter permease [Xanthovirga aplysinae]|uniref:iron ABC transporter permease n=1 Tax=Xanthovirga aplysinae TaxID=2529853 RepID=UPI0012BC6DA0|nr:iron ABC transporter permease [Xanthovirga aplysinae]MTI32250.1 iron ABC transporter permease [Xanthovirga aplysinae]
MNTALIQKRSTKAFVLLIFLAFLFLILDVSFGSVSIPFGDLLSVLAGKEAAKESWQHIIWDFRLPKTITALLVGAGLSLSGLLMQTLFRNPLAGPFVLGISSGASLGVALWIMSGVLLGGFLAFPFEFVGGKWFTVLASSSGAMLVLLLVLFISFRLQDSMSLLIIGLMFGSATGAIVSVIQYFSKAEEVQAYLFWTFGSLGGLSWIELQVFFPVVLLGLILAISQVKNLNVLLLGEEYARSMGMRIMRTRLWLILSTSLLAGSITAFCGPIAFVGIAVPHLARLLFQSADHKLLIPATILCGIILMLFCDILAQLPGQQETLPINAVTSLFGAPIVIGLIVKGRRIRGTFAR